MAKLILTRELAQAASFDAADRSMRKGGRTTWIDDDAEVAYWEFERLWPRCPHGMEPEEPCYLCDQDEIPASHQLSNKIT